MENIFMTIIIVSAGTSRPGRFIKGLIESGVV